MPVPSTFNAQLRFNKRLAAVINRDDADGCVVKEVCGEIWMRVVDPPDLRSRNASAVSDAPRVEWQVDSGGVRGASDTAV